MNRAGLFCAVLCTAYGTGSLFAQGNLGGLTGNIVDESGAVVADAAIKIKDSATNAAYSTLSTSSGVYAFRGLPPGIYQLEVEKVGFKKSVREQVSIITATNSTLDVVLSVGARGRLGDRIRKCRRATDHVARS